MVMRKQYGSTSKLSIAITRCSVISSSSLYLICTFVQIHLPMHY
uniref:Uncharacterized protein n=1 Tax=Arundo donax TaxID=35708 RepID=A0A0A8ZUW9_ARUDO